MLLSLLCMQWKLHHHAGRPRAPDKELGSNSIIWQLVFCWSSWTSLGISQDVWEHIRKTKLGTHHSRETALREGSHGWATLYIMIHKVQR